MPSIPAESISPVTPFTQPGEAVPGNRAIWVGIFAELAGLMLMFLVYFFARVNHPQAFHEGSQKLSSAAGTANTLVMISSSFLVARALRAMRADLRQWFPGCPVHRADHLRQGEAGGRPVHGTWRGFAGHPPGGTRFRVAGAATHARGLPVGNGAGSSPLAGLGD